MRSILRIQDAITWAGFMLGATALGAIVVIYTFEVISRYAFGAPTMWASDFVSFLLLISVFATGPWLTREGGHVAVTILPDMIPAARDAILRAGFFVSALVCLWAGWICLGENIYLFERGTVTLTTVRIPKWTLSVFITYGFLNSGLYFLRLAFAPPTPEAQNG
ncbi:Tripartite ATP-independent periplasmic transporters, DctQ component [Roseivivax jejudonensis]|uniref:TRAP transporter small permease protein n=1 Tax=Roseivivax jejudonensis TaxID=1529041 RepID=A0A1X7A004_9RHOB|nr:TRAP transporter small permease [Roseivivax jejudonensis]SLN66091.1 Tripartite ATP-independent periplasmic transporters, DctQ component [Roseivivax jejudonensis]